MASTLRRLTRSRSDPANLRDLARTFLRLGLTAFGGPAAHVALMRDEFVRRRGWIDDQAFVDLLGAANLIPGPTSTELAMHIGHRRAGWAGLIVAGLAFLLPAVVIVALLAWVYVGWGGLPAIHAVLVGVAPVVVAIIAHAGWAIARTALRDRLGVVVAGLAVAGALVGASEIALLLGLGALVLVVRTGARLVAAGRSRLAGMAGAAGWASVLEPVSVQSPVAVVWAVGAVAVTPLAVLGEFLKIGAVLFGSGYVLVALLRAELVDGLGWITERQLVDAIAVGQATPGPLFTSATFLGYVISGPVGAAAATIGVFAPAFLAVAVSVPLLARLRRSASFRSFLDGINAAAVGLLGVVAAQLAVSSLTDWLALGVAIGAFGLLVRGVGTGWLVTLGAGIGLLRLAVGPT